MHWKCNNAKFAGKGILNVSPAIESVMIALLFAVLAAFAAMAVFYRRSIQEYSILQYDVGTHGVANASALLSAREPCIFTGTETPTLWTENHIATMPYLATLPIHVQTAGRLFRQTVGDWLQSLVTGTSTVDQARVLNGRDLANRSGSSLVAREAFEWIKRPWIVIPALDATSVFAVSTPESGRIHGFQPTLAEHTIIAPSDQAVTVAIVHSRYKKYLDESGGQWRNGNPWQWYVTGSPLLQQVRFYPIVVRPGHVLVLPPHWYYAIAAQDAVYAMGYILERHGPISYLASRLDAARTLRHGTKTI
jgi:hypothetical protein